MEELEEAGWKAKENKTDEEIKDIDMKEMFDAADQERRNSQDLPAVPRRVMRFTPIQYKSNIFIQVYVKERRNSQDLLAVPKRVIRFTPIQYKSNIFIQVYGKFNGNTVAKVTGVVKFAKKQSCFMKINLDQQRKVAKSINIE
jgi:hypothetical protein